MLKVLIVRFSSLGDIAQALPTVQAIREKHPNARIDWVTRDDFADFVQLNNKINKVWVLHKKDKWLGLWHMCQQLKNEKYDVLYDAHNNLRSFFVRNYLKIQNLRMRIIIRSKNRFSRFLLFYLRINLFEKPFRGIISYLRPLEKWLGPTPWPKNFSFDFTNISLEKIPKNILPTLNECIVLAPSATWELKRWPIEYWQKTVSLNPAEKFIVLAGPEDSFCQTIAAAAPSRVYNLAGLLSWPESLYIIKNCKGVISGDTGILHLADTQEKPAIAIIGPTAFGFPSRPSTQIAEVPLPCRPCTKDGNTTCRNKIKRQCLFDIKPEQITQMVKNFDEYRK